MIAQTKKIQRDWHFPPSLASLFGCEFSLQNYRAHRFQYVLCSIHVFIFCRMDGENVKREWNWLQVFSLLEKSSHTVNHKAHFLLGDLFFFARTTKTGCDWLVMSSVFVAIQSSCFFLCSREQIRLVESRLKALFHSSQNPTRCEGFAMSGKEALIRVDFGCI